jgi:prenyltransferase beta subunit
MSYLASSKPIRLCLFTLTTLCLSDATARAAEAKIDEPTRKAVGRALEWLATKQNADGSWSAGSYAHNSAITSFSLLAFLSQGHLPNRGRYGPEVARGARFLIACARPDGLLIGTRDSGNGNMYCHAMATLTLAELWGMTGDDKIEPVLTRAVDLIVRCQNPEGGWRYQPRPNDADISVTIMDVMALRAAKNSGLHVPDETLKRAIGYINKCYNPQSGGYSYQPGQSPNFARSAAGMCVLQLSGKYDAKEIPRAVAYLQHNRNQGEHFWYGHYYAAHAMHQVGGKDWEDWYRSERDLLLSKQSRDGSWTDLHGGDVGPVYRTSIAVIILSVPTGYLPIYQR